MFVGAVLHVCVHIFVEAPHGPLVRGMFVGPCSVSSRTGQTPSRLSIGAASRVCVHIIVEAPHRAIGPWFRPSWPFENIVCMVINVRPRYGKREIYL